MKTFQQRLSRCVERGNLTVADLGRWFGRPYPTVRSWLVQGWEPGDGPLTRERMQARLQELETMLRDHGHRLRDLPMRERAQRMTSIGNIR
jgi:hypothetical protein